MANETIEEQRERDTSSTSTSPRRSHPPGRSGAPRSRSTRRRSANGCCGSSIHTRETRSSSLRQGSGDTGFEAAAIIGETGRLITSDFSPAMLDAARRRGAELGLDERRLPGDQRRAHRARRRFGRRRALPVRLHADARSRGGVRRDSASAAPGRPGGARRLGSDGAQPVDSRSSASASASAATSRRPPPPPAPGPFSMASAERRRGASCATPDSPRCGPRRPMGGSQSKTPTSTWA